MLDLFWKRHSQTGLRMLSQNISLLGRPSTPPYFLPKIPALSAAGPSARRMSDAFSQSRASSLVQGFENATQVWIVEAQPCVSPHFLSVSIRVIRGSKFIAPRAKRSRAIRSADERCVFTIPRKLACGGI
jgi:hypothetical protein